MKITNLIVAAFVAAFIAVGCNSTDQKKEINGTTDTSSVNRGGGPAIADTNTINQVRDQRKKDSISGDTTSKGNVTPEGQSPKK